MEGQNLTLLFLENDSQRIEQVEQLLLKAHFSLVLHVVKNEGDLLEAASLLPLQLILINSSLLSSPQQLKLLALFKKAPILFLSHPEEEENVFRLLSQGLDDCVFLDDIKSLPFRIKRILNEIEKNKGMFLTQNALLKHNEDLVNYQNAILSLAKLPFVSLQEMLENIVKIDAQVLQVERVGVWLFNESKTELSCKCLYQFGQNSFESGLSLHVKDYPKYFQALSPTRVIAVPEARIDSRTSEFLEPYLTSFDIYSMMDVPIRLHGEMIGVLCHEHVAEKRDWGIEEQQFASSIADMVSLALESSERQRIQEQLSKTTQELRRSNKELERFAYVASHDLKEPLFTLRSYIEHIQEKVPQLNEDSETNYALERMKLTLRRMDLLISDLLQYAKINAQPKPFQSLNLKELIENLREDYNNQILQTQADVFIDSSLPTIQGDLFQLRQLFDNLFSNAFKFRSLERPLHIKISSRIFNSSKMEIIFQDNGIGFSPEFEEQVFEPFFRLHSKQEYEGSGVGLSVCRRIANRHKASITAKSQPGIGTDFVICFSSFTS